MTISLPKQLMSDRSEPATVSKPPRTGAQSRADLAREQQERARQVTLPPIAAMLGRPLLLAVCMLIGGGVGFLATGTTGFQATAALEFTVDGNDVALVRLEGQTLANRATTDAVIQRAAAALGRPANEVEADAKAAWTVDSMLVDVTATGPTSDAAVATANAVATATVDVLRDAVNARLGASTSQANVLLGQGALPDPDAEMARRTEVGSSLAQRQGALKEQSDSVFVAVPATEAEPSGTPSGLGLAIGLAAGLFAGCLLSVLLGSRGLRVRSVGALRRMTPATEVVSPSQVSHLGGQLVEDGTTYIAIVATPSSADAAEAFASDVARILGNHGKTTTTIHPPATVDGESAKLLRSDVSSRVHELVGTDVLIAVVQSGTDSAAMLEGRSGLRTVVVLRSGHTPVAQGISAAVAYAQSSPVLVLAK